MTKSIEEQAKDFAAMAYASPKEKVIAMIAYDHGANWAAKARDAQLMIVVNELREALKFYAADINWNSIGHFINSRIDSTDMDNIEPFDNSYQFGGKKARHSLTKADQMLKEMGMK